MTRNTIWMGAAIFTSFLMSLGPALADASPKVDTTKPTPVVYPQVSQRAGEEGTVVLAVYVNDSGQAEKVDIAKSSGYGDLDTAAVETAFNWHYVPAVRGGETASDWARVQVVYKLPTSEQQAPAK
ncbi:MAG TPA: energy transducer TonB [Rhizomicrobium sp.]|nr:energy transducer TonB [Rhizomicrobium sp.]